MSTEHDAHPEPGFFERPGTIRAIQIALIVACVVVFLADFGHFRHGHFDIEEWPGFFALFGFVAYVAIVTTAKGLRLFVMRPEDYYDE